jgi:hypothetical protein
MKSKIKKANDLENKKLRGEEEEFSKWQNLNFGAWMN